MTLSFEVRNKISRSLTKFCPVFSTPLSPGLMARRRWELRGEATAQKIIKITKDHECITYIFFIEEKFEIDPFESSEGLQFRLSKRLVLLHETDQVFRHVLWDELVEVVFLLICFD